MNADHTMPPHDPHAEGGILAAMIGEPTVAKYACAELTPDHFQSPHNRALFALLKEIFERDGNVDYLVTAGEIDRRGLANEIGGKGRLGELIEGLPNVPNFERYLNTLHEMYEKRYLWKLQRQMAEGINNGKSATELLQELNAATSERLQKGGPGKGASSIKVLSAAEVMKAEEESADWLWSGYLARGCVTLEVGKPKIGKTTLTFGLLQAAYSGKPFLRRSTKPFGTVYLTEEAIGTIQEKVDRFGLGTHEGLHFISKRQNPGLSFTQALTEACRVALDHGAELLVIDTLTRWGGLDREGENSSGDSDRLMGWILDAAGKHNLAIKVVHHSPKRGEGSDPVDMVRGSSALAAAADIVIAVARDQAEQNLRRVLAAGRYAATPEIVTVKLNGEEYEIVDAPNNAAEKHSPVIGALPFEPPGKTEAELIAETGLARWKVQAALSELLGEGIALRTGKGGKADPYRYHRGEGKVDPF